MPHSPKFVLISKSSKHLHYLLRSDVTARDVTNLFSRRNKMSRMLLLPACVGVFGCQLISTPRPFHGLQVDHHTVKMHTAFLKARTDDNFSHWSEFSPATHTSPTVSHGTSKQACGWGTGKKVPSSNNCTEAEGLSHDQCHPLRRLPATSLQPRRL